MSHSKILNEIPPNRNCLTSWLHRLMVTLLLYCAGKAALTPGGMVTSPLRLSWGVQHWGVCSGSCRCCLDGTCLCNAQSGWVLNSKQPVGNLFSCSA